MKILRYEPANHRLHIKNKLRFILAIIIAITILALSFKYIQNKPKEQIEYTQYTVGYGETYWGLAQQTKEKGYDKDIRFIIYEMQEQSGIKAHDLKEGDTIYMHKIKEEQK